MSEAEKMPYFIDSVIFADTGMDFPKISEILAFHIALRG